MEKAKVKGKRLLSIFLVLGMLLGTWDFTAWNVPAAEPGQEARAVQQEPAVITLQTLGGTIASAVQGEEPDSRAWYQTGTGVYKRVINSFQRLPNPVAPCYSDKVKFAGWYDSMEYTNRIEDVFVENGSMTLYAKWVFLDVTGQNENMWYKYGNPVNNDPEYTDTWYDNSCMVDIRGLEGNNRIRTTYRDGGYSYHCKIGRTEKGVPYEPQSINLSLPARAGSSIFHKADSAHEIYVASLVTIDGTYATMHYIVANTGDTDVANFNLGYAADIMIGSDDEAYVTTCQDEERNCTYIQMLERGTNGKVFRLYVKGSSYGITDVDRLWIGLYNDRNYRMHAFDHDLSPTTGDDSAFACSWVNRTIPANSATIWSVKLGVGELSEMGDTSNTVTLDANGGVFRDGNEINIHSGGSIPVASLETPTRVGYKFDGWYLEREGGERQTGNITQSITLYAHWREALYCLVNDTVVQTGTNEVVPKETADITIHYGEVSVGREESSEEIIQPGQELNLSLEVTDGYYLPKSIYVDIEGVEGTVHLTEGTGYLYDLNSDRTAAQITVLPEYLTGDVIVTTIGHPVPAERSESVEAIIEGGGHRAEIALTDDCPVMHAVVRPEELPEHTYHYQWYENSEASNQNGGKIPGATEADYTFPSGRSLGEYYFYCVVTSERNNGQTAIQTSNAVTVHVKKAARTVTLADKEETVTGEPISAGEAVVVPDVADKDRITYVYYTDEACTEQTTTAAPEEGGSGALAAGGAPSAVGTYYVKAYVPEDEIYEAAENSPAAKLTIRPREHKAAILVRLDGEEWEGHGRTFCLVGTDGKPVIDLDKVLPGTYRIYDITKDAKPKGKEAMAGEEADMAVDGTDTGVTVTVEDADVEAVIDYYTATFYSEGIPYGEETPQKPQIILSGQKALQPDGPAPLPGYAFEGWMTEPDGEEPYDFSAAVAEKTDIHAKWSLLDLSYQVEHYLQEPDGSYTLQDTDALTGTIGEQKTAETKEYTGYSEDTQNESRVLEGTVQADGGLVLKLYYNLDEYPIHYDLDGGQLPDGKVNPSSYTVKSDDISLINPEKPGYAFLGWTAPGIVIPQKEAAIPSGSTGSRSFTANWKILELPYRVEHYLQNLAGGYTLEETEQLEGTFGEMQSAVAKEYKGYLEDTENEERIPQGIVAADGSLVLKLYYNLIEYKLSYDLDGGALPEGKENPGTYTVISEDITLERPEKEGHAFLGWTEEAGGTPTDVTIPSGSTGDRSFTANWEIQDYPYYVEHYLQDRTGGYTLRETEELEGIFGEEKTAEAKEYEGYQEDVQNEDRIVSGVIRADGSLALKLYYNPVEYRISYELNGGQLPEGKENPTVYTVISEAITLNSPEKEGYSFIGWTEEGQGTPQKETVIPSGSTGDKSFTANWEIQELPYRVEHYLQQPDGSYALCDTENFEGIFGEEKTAEAKEYKGYQEDVQNEDRIASGVIRADGSLALKLYYNPVEYRISYGLNGGQLPEGKENPTVYTVISEAITLNNPEKEGYSFTGWTEEGQGTPQKETVIPSGSTGDKSFAANWEIQELPYRVEHYLQNAAGGYTLQETERLKGFFGEEKSAAAKSYEGYREDVQNGERIPSGVIRADGGLVLRLYYNAIEYAIHYELNGGHLPEGKENPAVYTVISEDIILNNPEREGYDFIGWTEETRSVPQKKAVIPSGSIGERSFTANWEIQELPYRVEHYLQNAAGGYILRETERLKGFYGEEKAAEAKEYTGYLEDGQNPGRIPEGVISADGKLVLKLYYSLEVYPVGYRLDGGHLPTGKANPAAYTVQSGTIKLVNPVKEGYIFRGWTEQGSDVLMQAASIPAGSTGGRIFTANWEACTDTPYWVEHYQENPSGDGYSLADRELLAGTTGTVIAAQAKEYAGYTENTGHISRMESGTISARTPLVLRLYYDRQTYVITFIVDTSKADVHGKTVQTLRHGQAIAKPFVIPKPGYTLSEQYDGWDREVPANALGTATYTAQISIGGTALAEAERTITNTDTDNSDPKDSKFYPLMLRAYGQDQSIRLKWHRIKDADGYILYGSQCGSGLKRIRTIKNGKTTTCTMKKLKEGTYYKYLVAAYQNVEGKKRVMLSSKTAHAVTDGGKYGNPSNITCKPSAVNLKVGKAKALKPSYKETKKIRTHIAKFRFHSDNPKVASVSKKGKVKAKGAGSCNIYVYAQNGFYQKVKVKVTK